MKGVTSVVVLLGGLLTSFACFSSTPLNQHTLAVSQSMSAFYMYSLSEGDERYMRQFQGHVEKADKHLQQLAEQDPLLGGELNPQWQSVRQQLSYDLIEGAGYILPMVVRVSFREYLSLLYKQVLEQSASEVQLATELFAMALEVELMAARFFDISSSEYGVMGLSMSQQVIDPKTMSEKLQQTFDRFAKMAIPRNVKRQLRSVETKWRFIEDSIVNYKDEAAFLTVYFNKQQIFKLLTQSQETMAQL